MVFGDYIQKNLAFLEYKNGVKLSIDDTANFIRHELAEAIRKGPYNVNLLLAGFEGNEPRLYWLDYLGSLVQLTKAAHGYAEFLTSSVMDTLETKVFLKLMIGHDRRTRYQRDRQMPKLFEREIPDQSKLIHSQSHHQGRNQGYQGSRNSKRWSLILNKYIY